MKEKFINSLINFNEKFAKLIDVKSLVTLTLTAVFSHLSIIGKITAEDFIKIFIIIIGFYFGVQSVKKE